MDFRGQIGANHCNLFQNNIILSNSHHSGRLASLYSPDMPQKTPNIDCPIPVANLDHIGGLSGVKKVNNRLFARVD